MGSLDVTSGRLCDLAGQLTRAQFDKMAHALGWPDTAQAMNRPGRIKWAKPYRNHFVGSPADPDWRRAERLGLAVAGEERHASHSDVVWRLTSLGIAVTRIRLRAVREVTP